MDNGARKKLRETVTLLRRMLEDGTGEAAGAEAWHAGMTLALEAAMAARGVAGPAPAFFGGTAGVLPAAEQRGRELLAGCGELLTAPAALGWLNQFWHSGERAGLAGRTRGDQCAKIGAGALVPATQVYSEPYMAAFLAENSLGALWLAGRPDSALAAGWRYRVGLPDESRGRPRRARELTVCDPACGAGNFLLAAFDLLYGMYREEGADDPAVICASIVNGNLFGADIDKRAVAVARAVLWLRAKERAPAIELAALPGLYANVVAADERDGGLGSLLTAADAAGALGRLLGRRYAVVLTNPPYLDKRDYASTVRAYLRRHYPVAAGNLYAAFITRCLALAEECVAMVTPQSFLYLQSYAKLRGEVFGQAAIRTLAHLGLGAFADAVVDAALFVLAVNGAAAEKGVYIKLLAAPRKAEALAEAVRGHNAGERRPEVFVRTVAEATALPGRPLAYWLGDGLRAALTEARPLKEAADVVLGMKTADNARFVRRWWEIWGPDGAADGWVPYEKEASGFRYARRAAHYVRWTEGARRYYGSYYSAQLPNTKYWFREGLAYGLVSSKAFTAKLLPAGCMTDMAASCVFAHDPQETPFLLGLLNAKLCQGLLKVFNPTVNYQPVDLQRLPLPAVSATTRQEIGRLALVAAAAADELRTLEPTDRGYRFAPAEFLPLSATLAQRAVRLWLAALRQVLAAAAVDRLLAAALALPPAEAAALTEELGGFPDEWPALAGYETLPPELADDRLPGPASVRQCGGEELAVLKERLSLLYREGPKRGQLPEEFFIKLVAFIRLHPLTVYNLLCEGIVEEGWRCPPLEKEMALDFVSAAVLTLHGHAWPEQAAAADPGIMAIPAVRAALDELVAQRCVPAGFAADFAAVTGVALDRWLERGFFPRHVAQFKRRPVVWQLADGPDSWLMHWRCAGEFVAGRGLEGYAPEADWGGRVCVAPLQAAGMLAAPVLAAGELARALADWRRCLDGEYML
ncbi:Eco57I restriction-modification methylase domain-containing protein [Anaeroselena agilis]|uniref:site-specific DNA-methyltransferase (adenine-specific) n=1 Tax=Anaeroselena agilis TaxID=3063788 RepID=A0ABU3NXE0_9FIRM|nr:N-6 DNA methylase [Selenomonadales bacterium 4137-cl]